MDADEHGTLGAEACEGVHAVRTARRAVPHGECARESTAHRAVAHGEREAMERGCRPGMEMEPPRWTVRAGAIAALRRRADLVEDELDGEAILSDVRTGGIHRLNETALIVWRWCDGRTTTLQIACGLTRQYDVGLEIALDHVEQLLVLFAEAGLVEVEASS